MRRPLVLAVALAFAPPAFAQRAEPLAFNASPVKVSVRSDSSVIAAKPPVYAFPVRLALGVGASLAGGYGGIFAGLVMPHADCSCEDPGLENAVAGAAVGAVISSAVLAAWPKFESKCGLGQRIGTALLASTAGAVLGGFTGNAIGGDQGAVVGYIGGSGAGSALGAALCRR